MTTDDHAPGEPCSCSESNAQEFHELVAALASHRGIDVCSHSGLDAHDIDPDDDGDEDIGLDLEILHSLALAQGAHCEGDDMGDNEGDDDEPEVTQFSDDEDDEFDLDGMDDGDDDATFSLDDATDDGLVRTSPVDFG